MDESAQNTAIVARKYLSPRLGLRKGRDRRDQMTLQPSQGFGNLVPTSPGIASSETSVHATEVDAEKANSVGICLAN